MPRCSKGVTLLEVVFVMGIIGMGVTLLWPEMLRARDQVRASQCKMKLRQIAEANLSYESVKHVFPAGRGFPDWARNGVIMQGYTNYTSLNPFDPSLTTGFYPAHLWLLPHLGLQDAFDMFDFDIPYTKTLTSGGVPINRNFDAILAVGNFFICPDDPNTSPGGLTENNYLINFGGSLPYAGAQGRSDQGNIDFLVSGQYPVAGNGAFTIGLQLSAGKVPRGLADTAFFSERTKGSGLNMGERPATLADMISLGPPLETPPPPDVFFSECDSQPQKVVNEFNFNGSGRWLPKTSISNGWAFASYAGTEYNHVAPPNWKELDCTRGIPDTPGEHAIVSARSNHRVLSDGTVNVAFGDGHVEAVSGKIDLDAWRTLGNRQSTNRRRFGKTNVK